LRLRTGRQGADRRSRPRTSPPPPASAATGRRSPPEGRRARPGALVHAPGPRPRPTRRQAARERGGQDAATDDGRGPPPPAPAPCPQARAHQPRFPGPRGIRARQPVSSRRAMLRRRRRAWLVAFTALTATLVMLGGAGDPAGAAPEAGRLVAEPVL